MRSILVKFNCVCTDRSMDFASKIILLYFSLLSACADKYQHKIRVSAMKTPRTVCEAYTKQTEHQLG